MEPNYMQEETVKQENTEKGSRLPGKKLILVIGVVAAAVLIGIGILMSGNTELMNQLDLGQKYIEECNYEQAIVAFNRAIEIDKRCAEAYVGLAETYIRMGEFDKALEVAETGYEMTGDAALQEYIDMIQSGNISRSDGVIMNNEAETLEGSLIDTSGNEENQDSVSRDNSEDSLVEKTDMSYSEKFEDGSWRVYEYEEDGRRCKIICGQGQNVGAEEEITDYTIEEYDEVGRIIRREFYDKNFSLLDCYTIEYDEDGNAKLYKYYDKDGNMSWYESCEYDEDGKMKLRKSYDKDGSMSWHEIYEYDEKGKLTGIYSYYADGNLMWQEKYD